MNASVEFQFWFFFVQYFLISKEPLPSPKIKKNEVHIPKNYDLMT